MVSVANGRLGSETDTLQGQAFSQDLALFGAVFYYLFFILLARYVKEVLAYGHEKEHNTISISSLFSRCHLFVRRELCTVRLLPSEEIQERNKKLEVQVEHFQETGEEREHEAQSLNKKLRIKEKELQR